MLTLILNIIMILMANVTRVVKDLQLEVYQRIGIILDLISRRHYIFFMILIVIHYER